MRESPKLRLIESAKNDVEVEVYGLQTQTDTYAFYQLHNILYCMYVVQ